MAFVRLDSWTAPAGPPQSLLPGWALGGPVRRAAAIGFTLVVHLALLWVFLNRLAGATEPEAPGRDSRVTIYSLSQGVPAEQEAGSTARVQTAVAAAPTPLDLTIPTDLPVPEWSMARMRTPQLAASASAPAQGLASAGQGRGAGGGLGQFIGFGDGIGGELLLDGHMLETLRRAAVRAYPRAEGKVLVFLRVGPSGNVLAAVIKGGDRATASALSAQLVGKRLFQVRSPIAGSALVALPPIDMGSDLAARTLPGDPPGAVASRDASGDLRN